MKNIFLSCSTCLHNSSLMIVYILLKSFKVCWETTPIEKSTPHETYRLALQSIDWIPYETSPQCKCFRKHINQTQEIISQINVMPGTYFSYVLHGQLCGFQVLMAVLKAVKDSFCFISRSTRSQILGPKYEMVSVPLNTDFTKLLLNSDR